MHKDSSISQTEVRQFFLLSQTLMLPSYFLIDLRSHLTNLYFGLYTNYSRRAIANYAYSISPYFVRIEYSNNYKLQEYLNKLKL